MERKFIKLGLIALIAPMFLINDQQVNAGMGSVGGGHVSVHPSVHPTVHPSVHPTFHPSFHPSTTHVTTPHTSSGIHSTFHSSFYSGHNASSPVTHSSIPVHPSFNHGNAPHISTSRTLTRSVARNSVISSFPRTNTVNRNLRYTQNTPYYKSLRTGHYQTDFLFWNTYCRTYYLRPYYHYYPWMPYWIYNKPNVQANKIKQTAKKKHMGWIKVGDKLIAVPDKLYDKIKVGDNIELVDDTHIKINGKVYTR